MGKQPNILNQSEGNYAIAIAPNSRNVVLRNINQTGADYGVYAEEGNFTITDSLLTNNNSTAIFAFNVTNFIIMHSRTSENQYGIVTVDCQL
jgi:KaiC/GvpD/RAD55 family RecA-like ATPase